MAGKTSYEPHHNFPKLADESGFAFNMHRPRAHVDWNKIRLIDIDSLVRERKFVLIEQHVNDILNCALESEFDIRILNEGVLKLFRLAQLAIEYQQFCRHYLDKSIFVLKEEISSLIQELEITKKDLREKDEEIRKLKRKTKHSYRTLPYGNDNIAAMILKTLSQKSDLFPSTSNCDTYQYNRCSFCDKVFLNQLYLKSHISRRHENAEIPQRDITDNGNNENRLSEEITELKTKLKEMESLIKENKSLSQDATANFSVDNGIKTVNKMTDSGVGKDTEPNNENNSKTKTKDAEVSTNKDDYLLDKIEEWKKEEHEKYNKEINLLRTQILDTISSLKDKETKSANQNEPNVTEVLHKTICEQGTEIIALRNELNNSKIKSENENVQLRKEAEEQLALWTKRLEAQSKQHELLLQKLNNVAKEALESRKQAEREKERAEYLQQVLHESINNKQEDHSSDDNAIPINKRVKNKKTENLLITNSVKKQSNQTPDTTSNFRTVSDRKSLEILHQKAQELLNLERINSSSSDISSEEQFAKTIQLKKPLNNPTILSDNVNSNQKKKQVKINKYKEHTKSNHLEKLQGDSQKILKSKEEKIQSKQPLLTDTEKKGQIVIPKSPIKVVRAKITEEVNNRIVSAGMDPLKLRLSKNVFHKQRLVLQQQEELKAKKIPTRENVKHSILAYLDAAVSNKDITMPVDYTSPNKESKTIKLKSVLSNVKSKALSLVRTTDGHLKFKQKMLQPEAVRKEKINGEVTKRALALLKTPPGSAHSSPTMHKNSVNEEESISGWHNNIINVDKRKSDSVKEKIKKTLIQTKSIVHDDTSNSDSIESDQKHYKEGNKTSKSIDSLIKSPARRPASAEVDYKHSLNKYIIKNDDMALTRTQSAVNVASDVTSNKNEILINVEHDMNGESRKDIDIKRANSDENMQNSVKQTKGVLKNASSTSSLNKKKVLFDMDAIQMKSVSASPSQSITEKSDGKENYELGLINLDGEEWDISSIENEPLKNDTKIQVNNRTSPKIAELKETIESQLARRNDTPSTVRVGGVDIAGPMVRVASSIGGSNTSLGSSILDESDSIPAPNHRAFVKPKNIPQKDDSEVDISEFSIDGTGYKNESF
ncbi:cilium assembly protein DZIP1 [Plodia interpunctella]|uniref:cilium assembly protein DZIP1 n=1 Tax=Plodia interpunctella TaxID=58824 RepID=UPI002367E8B5|nr:cilium assembly protein DZIP1 [Plodia interpunctella]